jgi:hypothetical protein
MLHLNSRGACIVADLIENWVRAVEVDDRTEQAFSIGAAVFADPIYLD